MGYDQSVLVLLKQGIIIIRVEFKFEWESVVNHDRSGVQHYGPFLRLVPISLAILGVYFTWSFVSHGFMVSWFMETTVGCF